MLKFSGSLNLLKKNDISSPRLLNRWHKCVTCFLSSTVLKTTISTFSPENASGSNYNKRSSCFKLFGKISFFHIPWSTLFFTFSTISSVIPVNKFLLRFLFWDCSRNFFWKNIKWRWGRNSISLQRWINNNKMYLWFKYEAKILMCETDYVNCRIF